MLILAKAAMAMMLGFILSIIAGLILIPMLKKLKLKQTVSETIGERHQAKNGTPTLGGLIFILPTFATLLLLKIKGSIDISYNLLIVLIVFLAYGLLGFLDDYQKIRFRNNKGLTILFKLLCQSVIALVLVGLCPRYLGQDRIPHIAGASITCILSIVWNIVSGTLLIPALLLIVLLLIFALNVKDKLFWTECLAFLNIYSSIIIKASLVL